MNKRMISGAALLALAVVIIVVLLNPGRILPPGILPPTPTPLPGTCPNATTHIYVYGGYRYFEDPAITQVLCDKYGIEVKGEFRMGSYGMSNNYPHSDPNITVDCIYPASRIAVDYFEANHPGVIRQAVVTSTDLVVIYTWQDYLPTLIDAGIITQQNHVYFADMKALTDAMLAGQDWADLGVDITGPVRVATTAPEDSSTGAIWMAYLGSFLVPGNEDGSRPLTMSALQANPAILPMLYDYWENEGLQHETTAKLFSTFISQGEGMPMAVAYETSFFAWLSTQDEATRERAQDIVGVYPNPAVPAELTLVSLTEECDQLQHILVEDEDIIDIARQNSGVCPPGVVCDSIADASWLHDNETFPALVPEPKKEVVDTIQEYIDACSTGTPSGVCQSHPTADVTVTATP